MKVGLGVGGHFVQLFYIIQELFTPQSLFRTGNEMRRQFLPLFLQRVEEQRNILLKFARLILIGFCKDDSY